MSLTRGQEQPIRCSDSLDSAFLDADNHSAIPKYLPTYQPTNLPTYQPIYLYTSLSIENILKEWSWRRVTSEISAQSDEET